MVKGSGGSPIGENLHARCVGDPAGISGRGLVAAVGRVEDCVEVQLVELLKLVLEPQALLDLLHQTMDCLP